jgi:hypothetical protein
MSDPLRTDGPRAAFASEADHDAKIEQLLLAGLDQYFAGRYDQAINVWTRVLFLDRSHARARAYIERARTALAERQRESEELLQNGVAAFERGDGGEARRLVRAAIAGGAATDEALAVLDRVERLTPTPIEPAPARSRKARRETARGDGKRHAIWSALRVVAMFVLVVAAAGFYSAAVWGPLDWGSLRPPGTAQATPPATSPREPTLAVPRRGELTLIRARALAAGGHLRDALRALELVRPTDPEKADADRLRGEIQLQLMALTSVPPSPSARAQETDGSKEPPSR